MDIKTKDDWWKLTEATIPLLPRYMSEFHNVDEERLEGVLKELLECKDNAKLYKCFSELYDWLPDRPSIRHQPFFDLCDLCSEYWVFSAGQTVPELPE